MNKIKKTNRTIKYRTVHRQMRMGTVAVTLVLIGIIFFCTAGISVCKGRNAVPENAEYYRRMEKAYVMQARHIMDAEGYKNSGITMTYLIDETGGCTYVVKLHHERLAKTTEERKKEIFEALTSIDFTGGEVLYEFI